jgi:hypothetical protein
MLIIFIDIKGIDEKEFVLAGKIVNSAYYCDILRQLCKNVPTLCPELWQHFPFSPGNSCPKTTRD